MKKFLLSTALVMTAATAAQAQDAASPFRNAADPMHVAASEFIGKRIYALESDTATMTDADGVQADWEDIGEVNDVIINRDGEVDSVLVDIGGFLGIGERQIAVDMQSIRFVADGSTADLPHDYFLVMNANRQILEGAPEYSWSQAMDRAGAAMDDAAAAVGGAVDSATTAMGNAADQAATAVENTTNRVLPADAPETATTTDGAGYAPLDMATLTAEDVQGASVYDAESKHIGDVSELVLSPEGAVTSAVIDIGGFLGIGAKTVALPMDAVTIVRATEGDETRINVTMTKEQLEALPEYEG